MGYHNNEETTRKAIRDACRFINEKTRLEHALDATLLHLGVPKPKRLGVIQDVKGCDFRSLDELLKALNYD
jgi:hypothetical protein